MVGLLILAQGTFCENGFNRDEDVNYERDASDNAYGYAVTNAMLLVQVRGRSKTKPTGQARNLTDILRFLR